PHPTLPGGSSMNIHAVVFDLDGTLIDSRRDLAAAVNGVRGELGLEALPVERVVEHVGHGARNLVRRSLPGEVAGEDFEAAFGRFLEIYYDGCLRETRPYPGVVALLEALAGRLPLAVLTNKPQRHTGKILDGLGLSRHLRCAQGGDSLPVSKPHPDTLRETARRLGTPLAETLLVGDSAIDAETAKNAGAPAALVTWGFGTPEELAPFHPVLRPETPVELERFLRG
ncbi:MAG TPA: HAD-IA family hydrolase, partial [Thermoanaerobaculia bacterium]|nr:HAD-IA family hydrolase [Thermoanaerobaculia bacterium]